jgi:hypothetical protein
VDWQVYYLIMQILEDENMLSLDKMLGDLPFTCNVNYGFKVII